MGQVAGEDRGATARRDEQAVQVAKRMHHAGDTDAGQSEDQEMAERQVVIDGADQHDGQRHGVEQAAARRQDEDPPLAEAQRRCAVALPAEQFFLQEGDQAHGVQGL